MKLNFHSAAMGGGDVKTIAAVALSMREAESMKVKLEAIVGERLSLLLPCVNCAKWRIVNRKKDRVGETLGEVRGINLHNGLAHYKCICGEPFDLFIYKGVIHEQGNELAPI